MYRIVILGCENSHANNFLRLISEGKYPDIEVVGIYSNEPEAAKKLCDTYGAPIMENYDSLADSSAALDGVMITARHGDNHMKYALPYIKLGIPMFIDKPITCSEAEAIEFMQIARDNSIRLCGGSTCAALSETLALAKAVRENELGDLLGGNVVAPLHSPSPYGGFYFYAEHLIDITISIFGTGIKSVYASKNKDATALIISYEGFDVTATYLERAGYYSAAVYGTKSEKHLSLTFTPDSFEHEMNDMKALLDGSEMVKSYEDFILPVFVMNAVLRSYESGKKEDINTINL